MFDTSANDRLVALLIACGVACFVVYANLAILARHILRAFGKIGPLPRRHRVARLIWHALGILLILSVYDAFWREPDAVKLYSLRLQTPKLAHGIRIRIVQLSDLHLEGFTRREERALALVREARPDVIFLTGDYRNSAAPRALARFIRELRPIAPIYFVTGNWDSDGESRDLIENGAIPMEGRTRRITVRGQKLVLVGVGWYRIRALPGFKGVGDPRLVHIVLAHTCGGFETAARLGVDFYLCGHTHGGQVRLPIFGALLPEPRLVGKYQAGLYRMGHTSMYINRGLGMEGGGVKVRFCCRPEVTVIDLVGK